MYIAEKVLGCEGSCAKKHLQIDWLNYVLLPILPLVSYPQSPKEKFRCDKSIFCAIAWYFANRFTSSRSTEPVIGFPGATPQREIMLFSSSLFSCCSFQLHEIYYPHHTEAAINESLSMWPLWALFLNSLSFKGKDSFSFLAVLGEKRSGLGCSLKYISSELFSMNLSIEQRWARRIQYEETPPLHPVKPDTLLR